MLYYKLSHFRIKIKITTTIIYSQKNVPINYVKTAINYKVLYYDRIGINKTNASKQGKICHYWCVLDKRFKSPPDVCN